MIAILKIILHERSEQSKCNEVKGIKNGIENIARPYMDGEACVCLSVCLTACLPACLPACLSVCLSVCLSDCLSVCLSSRKS
jgi:hypothetical protein